MTFLCIKQTFNLKYNIAQNDAFFLYYYYKIIIKNISLNKYFIDKKYAKSK